MKTLKVLALAAFVMFSLSGCGFVVSLIVGEDVGAYEVTSSGGDILFYAANWGFSEDNVEFDIYFSTNSFETISIDDALVYSGSVDLEWSDYKLVRIAAADWQYFTQYYGDNPPYGNYYIKVHMDPSYKLDDSDVADNIGVSANSYDL
jgi:uncharacterized protein YceK